MADAFFPASYGGVRLWIARITTPNGRDVIVHRLARGDQHPIDDRGMVPRIASAELLFDDMSGETLTPRERFDRFRALVEGGAAHVFVHPLLGSYRARISNFEHTLEELTISATCDIVPSEVIPAVSGVTAGTSSVAGEHNVTSAAATFKAEAQAVGIESTLGDEAVAAAESWQEPDTSSRTVLVDVASLADRARAFIEDYQLEDYVKLWPLYRATMLLTDALLRGAQSATSEVSRTFTVLMRRPMALRRLMAQVYGAHEAEFRAQQVLTLNDIRTPGWIPEGTELRLPQAPSVQRSARTTRGL